MSIRQTAIGAVLAAMVCMAPVAQAEEANRPASPFRTAELRVDDQAQVEQVQYRGGFRGGVRSPGFRYGYGPGVRYGTGFRGGYWGQPDVRYGTGFRGGYWGQPGVRYGTGFRGGYWGQPGVRYGTGFRGGYWGQPGFRGGVWW